MRRINTKESSHAFPASPLAHAHFSQALRPNPVECSGVSGEPFTLTIQYFGRTGENNATLEVGQKKPVEIRVGPFTVGNEGHNYAAQAGVDTHYSLILETDDADALAKDAKASKLTSEYTLSGRLSVMNINAHVVCKARLALSAKPPKSSFHNEGAGFF
jgi:hypothetical protein